MDEMTQAAGRFVIAAMRWSTPWWWVCAAAAATTLALLNVLPLRVPPAREEEYGLMDVLKIGLRNVAVIGLVVLCLVYWPAMYFGTLATLGNSSDQGHQWFVDYVSRQAWRWGWLIPLGIIAGLAWRVASARYITPWLSRQWQRLLVRQEDHKQSDMRVEVGKLKARDFPPRQHYRDGQVFIGLDAEGQPTYLDAKTFRATHMQVVGPTRFGKGVVLGVMIEQAIRQGHGVVYIDPKADAFLPYIMAEACERAGRRFIYIDLASEDTRWAPFEGGTERDRRARIVNCFGLNNTGDGSDFYKSKERAILDTIMPKSGTSIAGLKAALEQRGEDGKPLKESANRLYDGLVEFGVMPSLNPKKGGGNKVAEALKSGASIYVRGSLDDATLKRATQVFITEVIQEARRLGPERPHHLTLAVDELKFMISQEISDALATIAGFNVNMVLLHQSIRDLRGPEDRTLNVDALESGVIVNCQIKLLYRASDPETAEWASLLSGTKIVRTTKSQTVEHNRFGGEAYTASRMLYDLEVPIITQNEMLSLSPRVGVLFAPDRLASVVFTCFVPADTKRVLYQRPQDKLAAPSAVAAGAASGAGARTPSVALAAAAVAPTATPGALIPSPSVRDEDAAPGRVASTGAVPAQEGVAQVVAPAAFRERADAEIVGILPDAMPSTANRAAPPASGGPRSHPGEPPPSMKPVEMRSTGALTQTVAPPARPEPSLPPQASSTPTFEPAAPPPTVRTASAETADRPQGRPSPAQPAPPQRSPRPPSGPTPQAAKAAGSSPGAARPTQSSEPLRSTTPPPAGPEQPVAQQTVPSRAGAAQAKQGAAKPPQPPKGTPQRAGPEPAKAPDRGRSTHDGAGRQGASHPTAPAKAPPIGVTPRAKAESAPAAAASVASPIASAKEPRVASNGEGPGATAGPGKNPGREIAAAGAAEGRDARPDAHPAP